MRAERSAPFSLMGRGEIGGKEAFQLAILNRKSHPNTTLN